MRRTEGCPLGGESRILARTRRGLGCAVPPSPARLVHPLDAIVHRPAADPHVDLDPMGVDESASCPVQHCRSAARLAVLERPRR